MSDPVSVDLQAYASQMAAALGIPVDDTQEVERNLAAALRMASLILDFPLPDDAEPAAVFEANPPAQ